MNDVVSFITGIIMGASVWCFIGTNIQYEKTLDEIKPFVDLKCTTTVYNDMTDVQKKFCDYYKEEKTND